MKKLLLVLVVALLMMFGCSDDSTSPENEAPGIPSNPAPSNGSSNISVNSNLSWSCSDPDGDALTYDVYFGTNPTPDSGELLSNNQSGTNYNPQTLEYETVYYWKIIASDGEFETASSIWDYTTESGGSVNHPPAEPYAPTPIDNADDVSISTSISWSCSDPDGDALTYDVYFGTDPTLDSGELMSSNQSGTNYNPATLEYETVYYWKIVASDGELETASPIWDYTTESGGSVNHPPAEPYNPTPIDNADDVSISTSISWSGSDPDGDALTYDVYFGTDPTPDNGELVSNNQSGTNYNPQTLEYETIYYWKIVASDGEYETEGDVWNFTTLEEASYGDLIFVEGGSFEMGDHFNEGSTNELPLHDVTLNSFYIGQYEVTQGEYEAVMGSNPAHNYGVGDDYPVYSVSWYNAVEYCNALSIQVELTPCYNLSDWSCDFSANGYRLPTEAEWEYSSRGGVNWTDNYRYSGTTDNLGDYAWYSSNSSSQTHEVGSKLPNQLDIYDMSGNVYEWCNDRYSSNYYSSSPVDNPTGPDSGSGRVRRGGYWDGYAVGCRVANRSNYSPGYGYHDLGFRILRACPY